MTSCAYHSPLYMYIIITGDYCTIISCPHTLYLIQLGSNLLVFVQPNSTQWGSCYYSLYLYQQEHQLLPNCTRKCVINYT